MTKILLVEDDKSLSEIYSVRLRAEGYDILSASDGEQALALAIKEVPDLIISDVMMPNISGFDMLDILRSTTETRGIHVIMMTALSSDEQRQRGMALGADRYLVKSQVGIEDVVRTVHEVLGDASVPADTPAPLVNEPKRATIEPGPSARATEPAPANNSPEKAESDNTKANELSPSSETPGSPASSSNPAANSTAPTPDNPAPTDTAAATAATMPASTTAAATPTAPQPAQPEPAAIPAAPSAQQPNPLVTAPHETPAAGAPAAVTNIPVTTPVNPVLSQPAPAATLPPPASAATAPRTSTLPQPIAPFSTNRPGSSGRVIQPITPTDQEPIDYTARMSEELATYQNLNTIPTPQANPTNVFPQAAPAATPAAAPTPAPAAPEPASIAINPAPSVAPASPSASTTVATPPAAPQPAQPEPAITPAAPAPTIPHIMPGPAAVATPISNMAASAGGALNNPSAQPALNATPPAAPAIAAPNTSVPEPAAPSAAPASSDEAGLKFEETAISSSQPK